jgi:hypothetical protein
MPHTCEDIRTFSEEQKSKSGYSTKQLHRILSHKHIPGWDAGACAADNTVVMGAEDGLPYQARNSGGTKPGWYKLTPSQAEVHDMQETLEHVKHTVGNREDMLKLQAIIDELPNFSRTRGQRKKKPTSLKKSSLKKSSPTKPTSLKKSSLKKPTSLKKSSLKKPSEQAEVAKMLQKKKPELLATCATTDGFVYNIRDSKKVLAKQLVRYKRGAK